METKIYLFINGQQKGPFNEMQVRSMYNAGTINAETSYWKKGMAEWVAVDALFAQVKKTPPNFQALMRTPIEEPIKRDRKHSRRVKRIAAWIIAITIVCSGILISTGGKILSNHSFEKIPIEIKRALNNIRSATEAGINKDRYASFVIELKSSISTYGQSLNQADISELNEISYDYEMAARLWNKTIIWNDVAIIDLKDLDDEDEKLMAYLKSLNINCTDESKKWSHHQYQIDLVMSQIWKMNNNKVRLFLERSGNR